MSPELYSPPQKPSERDYTAVSPHYLELEPSSDPTERARDGLVSALYRWDILRREGVYIRSENKNPIDVDFIEGLENSPHKIDRMTKKTYQGIRERFYEYFNELLEIEGVRGGNMILTMIDDQGEIIPDTAEVIRNIQQISLPEIGNIDIGHIDESGKITHTRVFRLGARSGWDLRFE